MEINLDLRKNEALIVSDDAVLNDILILCLETDYNFNCIPLTYDDFINRPFTEETTLIVLSGEDEKAKECLTKIQEKESIRTLLFNNKHSLKAHGELDSKDLNVSLNNFMKILFEINMEATQDFSRISFKTLSYFPKLKDEVYLKMASGRFIKIFSANDEIKPEDLEKYEKRGVEYFYLNRVSLQWLVKEINKDLEKTLEEIKAGSSQQVETKSNEEKVCEVFQIGEHEIKSIRFKSKNLLEVTKKHPKLSKILQKCKITRDENNYYNEHIKLLTLCCCGMARSLTWGTDQTLQKLIFCAQMHDILLLNHQHLASINSLEEIEKFNLTKEEKDLVLNHPKETALIMGEFPQCPPDSEKIVLQHHERSDAKGFPYGLTPNKLLPLSALFIVAHDFTDYIINNSNWEVHKFVSQSKYSGSHFRKIMTCFDNI